MHQIAWFWPPTLKNLPTVGGGTPPSHTLPLLGRFAPSGLVAPLLRICSQNIFCFHKSSPPPLLKTCLRHCPSMRNTNFPKNMHFLTYFFLFWNFPKFQSVHQIVQCQSRKCKISLSHTLPPLVCLLFPSNIVDSLPPPPPGKNSYVYTALKISHVYWRTHFSLMALPWTAFILARIWQSILCMKSTRFPQELQFHVVQLKIN